MIYWIEESHMTIFQEILLKVQKLFQEMVEEACDSLCFKMSGSVAIEIFTLPAQGLIITLTKEAEEHFDDEDDFNLRVKFDHCPHILYIFEDFEDIIQLSHQLKNQELLSSTLYFYKNTYYLLIENVLETIYDKIISLAAEYGNASTLTLYRMNEYGACLIKNEAIQVLTSLFRHPNNS